jgi:glycosyltransferase involved in cell wall biosynthesis
MNAEAGRVQGIGDYCIISPVRNEEALLPYTLGSVLSQTLLPRRWIIVDDGSTDNSVSIVRRYAEQAPFIQLVQREDRGHRLLGGGVVEAFNQGLAALEGDRTEFVCKLDVDLILPPRYFELLVDEMRKDPRLGSVSGKPYFPVHARGRIGFDQPLKSERIADDVSAGMTKFYRRHFLDDIGGLVQGLIWDGIDCYRGRMLGWRSCSIDRPELRFIHLRPMGSSDKNILKGRARLGEGYWFLGASPLFLLASAVYRASHKPVLIGSIATLFGFARAAARRRPRYGDPEFRRYLRRYHRDVLLRGRSAATQRADEAGRSIWLQRQAPEKH